MSADITNLIYFFRRMRWRRLARYDESIKNATFVLTSDEIFDKNDTQPPVLNM